MGCMGAGGRDQRALLFMCRVKGGGQGSSGWQATPHQDCPLPHPRGRHTHKGFLLLTWQQGSSIWWPGVPGVRCQLTGRARPASCDCVHLAVGRPLQSQKPPGLQGGEDVAGREGMGRGVGDGCMVPLATTGAQIGSELNACMAGQAGSGSHLWLPPPHQLRAQTHPAASAGSRLPSAPWPLPSPAPEPLLPWPRPPLQEQSQTPASRTVRVWQAWGIISWGTGRWNQGKVLLAARAACTRVQDSPAHLSPLGPEPPLPPLGSVRKGGRGSGGGRIVGTFAQRAKELQHSTGALHALGARPGADRQPQWCARGCIPHLRRGQSAGDKAHDAAAVGILPAEADLQGTPTARHSVGMVVQ